LGNKQVTKINNLTTLIYKTLQNIKSLDDIIKLNKLSVLFTIGTATCNTVCAKKSCIINYTPFRNTIKSEDKTVKLHETYSLS